MSRTNNDASTPLKALGEIAVEAGDIAKKGLKRWTPDQMVHKAARDFQTDSDVAVEKFIASELRRRFPDHGIQGEEAVANTATPDGHPRFFIDPIDGTTNFAWGIPHFGIVMSRERGGVIDMGVVYDPMQDELFSAELGHGSYLNGQRLQIAPTGEIVNTLIGAGLPLPGQITSIAEETYHEVLRDLMDLTSGVRRLGSASLSIAYVACCRLDGFIEDGLSPHDYGASALLVREAGGLVTRFDGSPNAGKGSVLAAGPQMHAWLMDRLASR
ncbi:MAG: inositol monophosphatase family protein [Pseudomonadota bacterium]